MGPRAGDAAAARLEAEVLLADVLGCGRGSLLTLDELSDEIVTSCQALVDRRVVDGYPVAYLVGRREFHELSLFVDHRVLVPRPETETLLDAFSALDDGGQLPPGPVFDWGTGSAAVALVAALRRPVVAVDRSWAALEVAAVNLGRNRSRPRRESRPAADEANPSRPCRYPIQLLQSDGLSAVRAGSLAAVLANPPYVSEDEWLGLAEDVRHEPRSALVPGDGDVPGLYDRLARHALEVLVPGGWLLTEIGWDQGQRVARSCASAGLAEVSCRQDLAGHDRVVLARRP